MPPKIESRTNPGLRPLHRALHPSKVMTFDGLLTLLTSGGLLDSVIIHGYSFNASIVLACIVVKVDKRPTELLIVLMSNKYTVSNLAIKEEQHSFQHEIEGTKWAKQKPHVHGV
ncbi:Uncharacterized protein Adt_18750 [Abeliophyllum distichum]|uniref:Uncharacterized protein n=1 Tax=Abeliophyllum distichum TaxID=126358 RepID=A0ABD1TK85_9LAMI